jgi:hypothetical protein
MSEVEFERFLRDAVDWDGYYTLDGEAMIKAHLDGIKSMKAELEQLRMAYGLAYTISGAGKLVVNVENPVAGMLEIIAQVTASQER